MSDEIEYNYRMLYEAIDDLFESWTPREDFEFFKVDGLPDNTTKHKLVY